MLQIGADQRGGMDSLEGSPWGFSCTELHVKFFTCSSSPSLYKVPGKYQLGSPDLTNEETEARRAELLAKSTGACPDLSSDHLCRETFDSHSYSSAFPQVLYFSPREALGDLFLDNLHMSSSFPCCFLGPVHSDVPSAHLKGCSSHRARDFLNFLNLS